MRIKFIAPIILACAAITAAQEPLTPERQDQREKSVLNEDGGQAFLVQPANAQLVGLLKPGQAMETEVADHGRV